MPIELSLSRADLKRLIRALTAAGDYYQPQLSPLLNGKRARDRARRELAFAEYLKQKVSRLLDISR